MIRTIYSGFTLSFWLDVAKILAKEGDWQPVYWIAAPAMESAVKDSFPDAIFHSYVDAVKGIPALEFSQKTLEPLDTEFLEQFSKCQLTTLRMMDRMDALDSFKYRERVRLFHRLLRYWRLVLDEIQPKRVVFGVIPHMVYDYVLYELCKQRGIQTYMYESTPLRGMTFVMEDFVDPSQVEKRYQQLLKKPIPEEIPLSEEMENYLQALTGTYRDAPVYVRRIYKERPYEGLTTSSKSFFKKIFDFQNYGAYFEKQKRIIQSKFTPPENYLKQNKKKPENSNMNVLEHRVFIARAHRKMRRLEAYYHRLAEEVDFSRRYIYVALSFQPERTTSPMGSIYVDQSLMVDLLAKSVPQGWHIYVKEHPFQLTPSKFYRAQGGRSRDFYDDLAAPPNASLVPMPINSFEMIDKARAVAAITGTVGWEALQRGKPVMVFGYPWYRGCEGVFSIDTRHSCESAIRQIQSGYQIDTQKLRLFAYALEKSAIRASVERHLQIEAITDEQAAERLARGILNFGQYNL